MNKEKFLDWLYLGHGLIVWGGALWQIFHTYTTKSTEDIALVWIVAMFIAHLLAIPRAHCSNFWVWKWCRYVSAVLVLILLIGVIIYR